MNNNLVEFHFDAWYKGKCEQRYDVIKTETLKELLQEKLQDVDIDQSHQIGKHKNVKQSRPINSKFARYNIRSRVFKNKKKLKYTGINITKKLTQK